MTVEGSTQNPSAAHSTGEKNWSVVTETIDSGGSITMDGDVIADAAFATTDTAGVVAHVTGVSGADVTVETLSDVGGGTTSTGDSVTVIALTA